ncbi:hypothetical protein GCM10009785_02220 [Brooklawnia cerclae]|uniref:FmdB family regulatory protein n=1 Tax=Brooklawnia cerclae TaxID=349934 RepID=A0ABX0SCX1_9ACTN|nr:zinc ribbon domain-containing protein [Brooklawnia cerclae]NIH56184.1 putative FmdB family regulatory protein [Brooklawnia cerclae]
MILYDFACPSGHEFEALIGSMSDDDPACPTCGRTAARRPSKLNIGGLADPGPSRDQMPRTWVQTNRGDRETLRHWHDLAARRDKLEDKHPELAGDRRPVLAHEGVFARRPLRAGDDIATAVREATSAASSTTEHDTHDSERQG